MLRALLGGFLLLLAHAVETRAQNARARGSACWERLASEEDVQPSQNSFNHKSKRTRCPRVGVSLECDVPWWHPSVSGGISYSEAQLSTAFFYILGQLTRRPTKLLRPIFDSPPRHRAVAPPAGPNEVADLWAMTQFLKNRSQQL